MSERALGFVEEWISENVSAADQRPDGDDSRAKALASQCLAAANAQGISQSEIGEAIDDLPAFIAGAIAERKVWCGRRHREPGSYISAREASVVRIEWWDTSALQT